MTNDTYGTTSIATTRTVTDSNTNNHEDNANAILSPSFSSPTFIPRSLTFDDDDDDDHHDVTLSLPSVQLNTAATSNTSSTASNKNVFTVGGAVKSPQRKNRRRKLSTINSNSYNNNTSTTSVGTTAATKTTAKATASLIQTPQTVIKKKPTKRGRGSNGSIYYKKSDRNRDSQSKSKLNNQNCEQQLDQQDGDESMSSVVMSPLLLHQVVESSTTTTTTTSSRQDHDDEYEAILDSILENNTHMSSCSTNSSSDITTSSSSTNSSKGSTRRSSTKRNCFSSHNTHIMNTKTNHHCANTSTTNSGRRSSSSSSTSSHHNDNNDDNESLSLIDLVQALKVDDSKINNTNNNNKMIIPQKQQNERTSIDDDDNYNNDDKDEEEKLYHHNNILASMSSYSDGELYDFFHQFHHPNSTTRDTKKSNNSKRKKETNDNSFIIQKNNNDTTTNDLNDSLLLEEAMTSLQNIHKHYNKDCDENVIQYHPSLHTSLNTSNQQQPPSSPSRTSLNEKYLRANLKSALIALQSIKAERNDIEMNLNLIQTEYDEYKMFQCDLQLVKEEEIDRLVQENKKLKEELLIERESNKKNIRNVEQHDDDNDGDNKKNILQLELDEMRGKLLLSELENDHKQQQIHELESTLKLNQHQQTEISTLQSKLSKTMTQMDIIQSKLDLKEKENKNHLSTIELLEQNVNDVKSKLDEKEDKIVHLNTCLDGKQSDCDKYESLFDDAIQTMKNQDEMMIREKDSKNVLTLQIVEMKKAVQTLKDESSRKDNEILQLQTQFNSVNLQLQQALENSEKQSATIDALNGELIDKMSGNEMNLIKAQLDRTKDENKNIETKLQEAYGKIKVVEMQLQEADQCRKEHLETIGTVNEELESKACYESDLLKQIASLQATVQEKDYCLTEVTEQMNTMSNTSKSQLQSIDELKSEVALLRASKEQKDDYDVSIISFENEMNMLKTQIEELGIANNLKEDQLEELDEKLREMKLRLEEAHEYAKEQQNTIDVISKDLKIKVANENELFEKIKVLKAVIRDKDATLEDKNEQINILSNASKSQLDSIDALTLEVASMRESSGQQKANNQELHQARDEIAQCRITISDLNAKIQTLTRSLKESDDYSTDKDTQLNRLQNKVKSVENKLQEAIENSCQYKASIDALNSELTSVISEKENMRLQIEEISSEKNSHECELDEAYDEIKLIRVQLQEAEGTIDALNDELQRKVSNQIHFDSKIAALEESLKLLRQENTDKETKSEKVTKELTSIQESQKEMDAFFKQQQVTINDLEKKLASKMSDEKALLKEICVLESTQEDLKNDIKNKESLAKVVEEQCETINKLKENLESKVSNEKSLTSDLEMLHIKLQESCYSSFYISLIITATVGTGIIRAFFMTVEAKLQDAQSKIREMEQELKTFRDADNVDMVTASQGESDMIDALNLELASKVSNEEKLRKDIEILQNELKNSRNSTLSEEAKLIEAHNKIKDMEIELQQLRQNIDATTDRASKDIKLEEKRAKSSNSRLSEDVEKVTSLDVELQDHLDTIDNLNIELAAQLSTIKKNEEEIVILQSIVNELKRDNDILTGKIDTGNKYFYSVTDNNDVIRKVVMELVDEIELMKSVKTFLCSKCVAKEPIKNIFGRDSLILDESIASDDDQNKTRSLEQDTVLSLWKEAKAFQKQVYTLNHELKTAVSKTLTETERANDAVSLLKKIEVVLAGNVKENHSLESVIQRVKDRLWVLLLDSIERLQPNVPKDKIPAQDSQSIIELVEALDMVVNSSELTSDEGKYAFGVQTSISPVSANGGCDPNESKILDFNSLIDDTIEHDDENSSFVAYLKNQLDQNAVLIRSALNDMTTSMTHGKVNNHEDDVDDEDLTVMDVMTVDFKKYECLRRKCDMLESERDGVISDTFALLDITKREHEAEIEAVKNRVKKEAAIEIAQCREELLKVSVELTKLKEFQE